MTDYLRREDIELHNRVDAQMYYELSSFYFEEADLLDEGRYVDWLDLFDDDLFYWAPTRTNRLRRQQALSISEPGGLAFTTKPESPLRGVSAVLIPVWRGRRIRRHVLAI